MAARLILHIGTEKTGSTAIQRFLLNQKTQLARQGIAVPSCLGQAEHARFPLLFYNLNQNDDLSHRQGLDGLALPERQLQLKRWIEDFEAELGTAQQATWIISSEHIHSRILHNDRAMIALLTFMEQHFENFTVITYLREPIKAAMSLWSTAVLNGAPLSALPPPENPYWARLCNHQATVNRLEHWFHGHFLLRLYTPEQWVNSDVIQDFAAAVGISLPSFSHPPERRVNQTLSWLSLALIASLNRKGKPAKELVGAIREAFDHHPPPRATAQQRAAYAAAFGESNAWLHRHYFPDRSELFPAEREAAP